MNKKSASAPQSEAENFVNFQRRKYLRDWDAASKNLDSQAVYEWMADRLAVSGLILEVGCGTGLSTLELLRRGNKVIAVEENYNCLSRTRAAAEQAGYKVKSLTRSTFRPLDSHSHAISYGPIKTPKLDATPLLLVEGNILKDEGLVAFLKSVGPFDAMACWLIGGHGGMRFNRSIDFSGVESSADYRLFVQNVVYELAEELLKPAGVLHLVDRADSLTPELLDEWREGHREQAEGTSLDVQPLEHRPYTESEEAGAMQMTMTLPNGEQQHHSNNLSLVSVRSVKADGP